MHHLRSNLNNVDIVKKNSPVYVAVIITSKKSLN